MGVAMWALGCEEFVNELIHLLHAQGFTGLNRGPARKGAGQPLHRFTLTQVHGSGLIQEIAQQLGLAARAPEGRNPADEDALLTKLLYVESHAGQTGLAFTEEVRLRLIKLQDDREEQLLTSGFALNHAVADLLVQDPLVGSVLVDDEKTLACLSQDIALVKLPKGNQSVGGLPARHIHLIYDPRIVRRARACARAGNGGPIFSAAGPGGIKARRLLEAVKAGRSVWLLRFSHGTVTCIRPPSACRCPTNS